MKLARMLLPLLMVISYGCMAPAALLISGAAGGMPGMKKPNSGQNKTASPEMLVAKSVNPHVKAFDVPPAKCMSAVVETLLQSGESLNNVSEEQVRTVKREVPAEFQPTYPAICSNNVSIVKVATLSKQGKSTAISLVLEAYRKTIWSEDVEREWVGFEAQLNDDFFQSVSDKIKPVAKKRRASKRAHKSN